MNVLSNAILFEQSKLMGEIDQISLVLKSLNGAKCLMVVLESHGVLKYLDRYGLADTIDQTDFELAFSKATVMPPDNAHCLVVLLRERMSVNAVCPYFHGKQIINAKLDIILALSELIAKKGVDYPIDSGVYSLDGIHDGLENPTLYVDNELLQFNHDYGTIK